MIFYVFYVHLFLHISIRKIHGQFSSYFNTQQEADLLSLNLMYKQQINFTADAAAVEESTVFALRESIILHHVRIRQAGV